MERASEGAVTSLLVAWRGGDEDALAELSELVYDDLRQLAAARLRRERPNHTLQPTELVNETMARLLSSDLGLQDRQHFFAVASRAMRRVLVDHARARKSQKRGGDALRVTFAEVHALSRQRSIDVIALDQALNALAELDAEQARLIELYYFAGLTLEETAATVGRSRSTVHRLLRSGQAWLYQRLRDRGKDASEDDQNES